MTYLVLCGAAETVNRERMKVSKSAALLRVIEMTFGFLSRVASACSVGPIRGILPKALSEAIKPSK